MLQRLRHFRRNMRDHLEIARMSQGDIDDLGLTRADLHHVVDVPDAVSRRMADMAARHGLSEADLNLFRHEHALFLQTCAECYAAEECRGFLADPSARAGEAGFCPNHSDYQELAASFG